MRFKQHPLGSTISGSPHSVCVSLPKMAHVRGYEEKDPEVLNRLRSGYPRFLSHQWIERLGKHITHHVDQVSPYFCATRESAAQLLRFAAAGRGEIRAVDHFHAVLLPKDVVIEHRAHMFLQHTGTGISSREAEDALLQRNLRKSLYLETVDSRDPEKTIRDTLHKFYGTAEAEDIILCRGGMNAFYTGFQALREFQAERQRHIWVQLGWLYVDTTRILEKFSAGDAPPQPFYNVLDLESLARFLKEHGRSVAGIVTEVPNNPLVQTCDLPKLHALCRQYGVALILDPTIASPHNVNLLEYSDLHINSLTKYASWEGDTLLGALALNRRSPYYSALAERIHKYHTPPYPRDLARLAHQIPAYHDVVKTTNEHTPKLVAFLENHPAVDRVWWAWSEDSAENYRKITHQLAGPGAVFTFTLRKPLESFYDEVRFAKGPSFGTKFTMLCPFLYLAHYDLVRQSQGRAFLESIGLPPDLIRFSVGLEPIDEILTELDRALLS